MFVIPRLSILPTFIRELVCSRSLPREPEPDLVMSDAEQVEAYKHAGRIDGVMSAAYLFHTAHISSVIKGKKRVLDLGCGPATQLVQVAELNPEIEFVGVDLSETMLEQARDYVAEKKLTNVNFKLGDITDLSWAEDQDFDGIMSTMALHHLPTADLLECCFNEIERVRAANSAIYLTDFARLKSLKSVIFFAYMNRGDQPHIFSIDYERSLRAAFLYHEFVDMAQEIFGDNANCFTTFGVPFLTIVKSKSDSLDESQKEKLKVLREGLPLKYRKDLDELRFFFQLGGMSYDPFS